MAIIAARSFVAALVILVSGCESGDNGTKNAEFSINPSNATLPDTSTTVVLQAVGGHIPLVWQVSDSSLGTLSGDGQTVTYTRIAGKYGVNLVTVTDSMAWTATATISQPANTTTTNTLPQISPASVTLVSDGNQVVFTGSGGSEPYTWSVGNGSLGRSDTAANNQTLYTRLAAGDNTVIMYDADGQVAVASISQPTSSLTVTPDTASIATNGTQVFVASGGTGVYAWSVQSGDGTVAPAAGASTVFTSTGPIDAVVKLSDGSTTVFAIVSH
jgi:hypothetical protein